MRIGMIGLGDIAEKAYLPILATYPGVSLRLITRNRRRLDDLADRYRAEARYDTVAEGIAGGLDAAFVHSSTESHVEIVEELLAAGVHVFVDKPIAYSYGAAERVVRRAEALGCSLVVGFNRRYAPFYRELLEVPRGIVVMSKNRVGVPEAPRQMVFDDFIHVVDTLRFLAPVETPDVDVRSRSRDGRVHHVVVTLSGAEFTAIGMMNRLSGATEEVVEVSGDGVTRRIVDLAEGEYAEGGVARRVRSPTWTPMLRQRGFEAMCGAFLDDVRAGRVRSADDALSTHALCERITIAVDRQLTLT